MVEAVKQGDYQKANQLYHTVYKEYRDAVLSSVTTQIENVENTTSALKADNKAIFNSSKNLMFIVMGIGFLGSLALGILLSQHLIRRIRKIKDLTERMEKETLSQTVSDDGTDELGQMIASLNKSVENMKSINFRIDCRNTRNVVYNRRIICHNGRDFCKYGEW